MVADARQVAVPSMLDAAREYLRRGWFILPIPRGSKAPAIPRWPSLRLSEADLVGHFGNDENVGVILGSSSGSLVVQKVRE